MGELDSPETPSPQLRIGRLLFALSVVASGIFQLVTGRFVSLVPVNPDRLPPPWQAYLFGVLFVLIGVGLLVRRAVSAAAIALAALLLVLFFGFSLPLALPLAICTQTAGEVSRGFQALSDSGVAFMLAGTVSSRKRRNQ